MRAVLQQHELESMRRSLAMSPTLPEPQILSLIETCSTLLAERVRIERVLAELGPSWSGTRRALNELHRIIKPVEHTTR
jgi:hypothetical protein